MIKYNDNEITVETITPEIAEKLLANPYPKQRKQRSTHINRLTTEMKEGKFRLSSDAIVLINGKLANGQHRLAAIVKSGVPQTFLVLRTTDESIWNVIDEQLIVRNFADICGPEMPYSHYLSATINYILKYDAKKLFLAGNGKSPDTNSHRLEYLANNQELIQWAIKTSYDLYYQMVEAIDFKLMPLSVGAAFLILASRKEADKNDAVEFVRYIYTQNSTIAFPESTTDLRNWLIKYQKNLNQPTSSNNKLAMLIRVYNAYKTDKKLGKYSIPFKKGDEFPRFYFEQTEDVKPEYVNIDITTEGDANTSPVPVKELVAR